MKTFMHENQFSLSALQNGLRKIVDRFLMTSLPKKTKRLVFLSSLVGYITKTEEPDRELLQKINRLLSLSENDRAMVLPMYVSKTIWHNKIKGLDCVNCQFVRSCDQQHKSLCMSHKQMCQLSNAILDSTPAWMVYASPRRIRHDVMTLLANLPNLRNYSAGQVCT